MKLKVLWILGFLIGLCLLTNVALAEDAGPPTAHQSITEYTGAETCVKCHRGVDQQVAASMHYAWLGVAQNVDGAAGESMGMRTEYCGLPASITGINWLGLLQPQNANLPPQPGGCAQCHIGFGMKPNPPDALTDDDKKNIDCLICHGPDYQRTVAKVTTDTGEAFRLVPATGVDAVAVAQKAQRPTNEMCLRCHLSTGGGPNVKHGDSPTSPESDVHLAAGLQCTDCHEAEEHRFGGSADLKAVDRLEAMLDCRTCHDGEHTGDAAPITMHLDRIACQTCHIPAIARDPAYPTLVRRDWTQPAIQKTGLYAPSNEMANNLTPEYRWWNGQIQSYPPGPVGAIDETDAKIYPWKYVESIVPIDAVSKGLIPIKQGTYYITGSLDLAVAQGAALSGVAYSGKWEPFTDALYFSLNHQVAPAEEALSCTNCHTEDGGRLNFAALGYSPKRATGLERLFTSTNPQEVHSILTHYDGPQTCRTCHPDAAKEVVGSLHYSWSGVAENVADAADEVMGMSTEYCGLPASVSGINWLGLLQPQDTNKPAQPGGCAQCHVGFGAKPNPPDALTPADEDNVDCLICHGPNYRRTVVKDGETFKLATAPEVDVLEVVRNVQQPTNEMCLRCHLSTGGGPNYKHGVSPTSPDADVHLAAGLQCVDCHPVEKHRFGGSADLKGVDQPNVALACTDCHDAAHTETSAAIGNHLDRVACQACHIPAIARDPQYPTLTFKDWTKPTLQANGLYAAAEQLENNVTPTYRWWNGQVQTYPPGPVGSKDDANARLYPWKYVQSVIPVDASSKGPIPLKLGVYYITGDLDKAVAQGAEAAGQTYSGKWEALTDELYFSLNHQVAPAKEALLCIDCHGKESARLDFAALGYDAKRASDLTRLSSATPATTPPSLKEPDPEEVIRRAQAYAQQRVAERSQLNKGRDFVFSLFGGIAAALVIAVVAAVIVLRRKGVTRRQAAGWVREKRRPILAVVLIVFISAGTGFLGLFYLFEYTASTEFCGTVCHATQPEYETYQRSFHAHVSCTECHVGPELGQEVKAKLNGLRELYLYTTNTYERPIPSPVETLRPARNVCEHCHWPQVFYNDRAVTIPHFANDEANTRTNTTMLLKIGGGTERLGQGQGIHWHIENKVEYIATDPQRQNIPWVRAELNSETVTFVDVTNPLSAEELQQYEVRQMDCIDCHNRATHVFRSTDEILDEALANGILPTDLPYFRQQAWEAMEKATSTEAAMTALAAIPDYYRQNYPEIYQSRKETLDSVVPILQDLYNITHFPAWEVDADTYPDNLAHSDSPGCFRCHNGKHYAEDNSAQSIRLHCNICHTIPQTVEASAPAPQIPFAAGLQPDNHLSSTWMSDHRYIFDNTCIQCHDEQTFCANPNCHGRAWPYVDLSVTSPPFPLP